MSKSKRVALALAGMMLLLSMAVYASYRSELIIENKVSTGVVNISLNEYQSDNGKLEPYANGQVIAPAQFISKIPTVTCKDAECWVRVNLKWTYDNTAKEPMKLTDADLVGLQDKWRKIGDYYYYTEPLNKDESAQLFEGIQVPSYYTGDNAGQKVQLTITAEAIQAANTNPDFNSDQPWVETEIVRSIKVRDNTEISDTAKSGKMVVQFEGEANKLVSGTDDFFSGLGEIMPGDRKTGTVTVKNTTKNTQDLTFSMKMPARYTKSSLELLERLNIEVKNDDEIVYNGTIADAYKAGNINLGRYKAGGSSKLSFTIQADEKIDNSLALTDAVTIWKFSAVSADDKAPTPDKTPSKITGGSGGSGGGSAGGTSVVPVKTGDTTNVLVPLVAMVVAGLFLASMLTTKKK